MRAKIVAELVVGRGLILKTGEVVDASVFGNYLEFLLNDGAIELVEPIIAKVESRLSEARARSI